MNDIKGEYLELMVCWGSLVPSFDIFPLLGTQSAGAFVVRPCCSTLPVFYSAKQVLFVNHSITINIFRFIYRTHSSIKETNVLINFIVHRQSFRIVNISLKLN